MTTSSISRPVLQLLTMMALLLMLGATAGASKQCPLVGSQYRSYGFARPGSCGKYKVAYGIIKTRGRDCRAMGGAMNGNPGDSDWTTCHLDFCDAYGHRPVFVPAPIGTCIKKVAYGTIHTTAWTCKLMGGDYNGRRAKSDWIDCHLDWCNQISPGSFVAASGFAKHTACGPGHAGRVPMTGLDCKEARGVSQLNPYHNKQWKTTWTQCEFNWYQQDRPNIDGVLKRAFPTFRKCWTFKENDVDLKAHFAVNRFGRVSALRCQNCSPRWLPIGNTKCRPCSPCLKRVLSGLRFEWMREWPTMRATIFLKKTPRGAGFKIDKIKKAWDTTTTAAAVRTMSRRPMVRRPANPWSGSGLGLPPAKRRPYPMPTRRLPGKFDF